MSLKMKDRLNAQSGGEGLGVQKKKQFCIKQASEKRKWL